MSNLPKQTVAQAFVIWRVPIGMAISLEMLLKNIDDDIDRAAAEHAFHFSTFSRRATPARTLRFVLERDLLTERQGLITRNDRTKRYIARLPEEVVDLIEGLPVSDPLILLAGASRLGGK